MATVGGGTSTASGARPTAADLIVGSASVGGTLIAVAATSSPGTILHTVPDSGLDYQRVRVWAVNIEASANRTLIIQLGGTSTKDQIIISLGARRGLVLVVPDLKLVRGSVVRAWCATTNVINCAVGVGERDKLP